MKISFLSSHGGSVARSLIQASATGELNVEIGPLITNNRESQIFHWCTSNGVDVHHISSRTHPNGDEHDLAICSVLTDSKTDYVVLSGYMKKIGSETLKQFDNRILNIHPALLPKFGGRGMFGDRVHEMVLASKERVSGVTVHVINEQYDDRPILRQEAVSIEPNETLSSLRKKIQTLECRLILRVVKELNENAH